MLSPTVVRRAAQGWRIVRTAIGFAVFGIGALCIALVAFPLLRWLPGDSERRAQRLVQVSFQLWVWFATGIGLIRVRWCGDERLDRRPPCVIVANHPTLIDVVLLISRLPQADCVVKDAAWRNPVLRGVVSGAGYIRNDAAGTFLDACVSRVRRGRWLVLFPEGTRSPTLSLGRFQRGAAHVALRAGVPLLPIVITCDPPTLRKGERWYQVPDRTAQFTLQVGEPISPATLAAHEGLAARELTAEVRKLYERRLQHVGD
jgi:1-acyl-sn-glycerol-3-phosphate acyltransferase